MTEPCPVCGLVGAHKLQCPEREDGQLKVPVNQTETGYKLQGISRVLRAREAIASVALSHPPSCECDVCEASQGDEEAFERILASWIH